MRHREFTTAVLMTWLLAICGCVGVPPVEEPFLPDTPTLPQSSAQPAWSEDSSGSSYAEQISDAFPDGSANSPSEVDQVLEGFNLSPEEKAQSRNILKNAPPGFLEIMMRSRERKQDSITANTIEDAHRRYESAKPRQVAGSAARDRKDPRSSSGIAQRLPRREERDESFSSNPAEIRERPSRVDDFPVKAASYSNYSNVERKKTIESQLAHAHSLKTEDGYHAVMSYFPQRSHTNNRYHRLAVQELEKLRRTIENESKADEPWRDTLLQLIKDLESQGEESLAGHQGEGTEEEPLSKAHRDAYLGLLYVIAGDADKASEAVEGLSPAEQGYWANQMLALSTYLDPKGPSAADRRAMQTVQRLRKAIASLAEASRLEVRELTLCSNVESYGRNTPFAPEAIRPGMEMLLYFEIANLKVRDLLSDRGYETRFGSYYDIRDSSGTRVDTWTFPDVIDTCRNHRQDYFVASRMYLPDDLKPGEYTLTLSVTDLESEKIGETAVSFEIPDRNKSLATLRGKR